MKEEKEKENPSECCRCSCTSSIFSSSEEDMDKLRKTLVTVVQVVGAWIALVILLPFLFLVFGSLFLWKYGVVWVIVKLFKRKFIRRFYESEGVFAIDRFWESSRSSLGLIVELDGPINVDTFRDEFRKRILDFSLNNHILQQNGFTSSSSFPPAPKPFAKLTQIPSTFCGYYFWRKANYFLIHEHIRQINQPTDELGLKKAVGTLMTLPFPNRRPLWEILVYSNYLGTTTFGRGTTCGSALLIRIHRSVTDSEGLMNLLKHMLNLNTLGLSLDPIKAVQITSISGSDSTQKTGHPPLSTTIENKAGTLSNVMLEKLTNLVVFPLRAFRFAQKIVCTPNGIATSEDATSACSTDSANASWSILSHSTISKICSEQAPIMSGTTIEMALFLDGITNRSKHKCLNVPEEKGVAPVEGNCQIRVLIPVPQKEIREVSFSKEELLTNDRSFLTVTCPCGGLMQTSSSKMKMALLRSIQNEFDRNRVEYGGRRKEIVKLYLKLLSLFPRHLLRYLIMSKRWGAGCFLYEEFLMDFPPPDGNDLMKQDLKVFGLYRVSQVVPLVGLQWAHTVASAATLKMNEENVIMSLIANSGIVGQISQANPQEHVERIVRGFPEELERLAEDSEDHGFVVQWRKEWFHLQNV